MNEVYKAMQALRCVWHQINNYRVLCRWQYSSGLPSSAQKGKGAIAAASPALAALMQLNPLYPQYQTVPPASPPKWAKRTSNQAIFGAMDSIVTPFALDGTVAGGFDAVIQLDHPRDSHSPMDDIDEDPIAEDPLQDEGVDDMDVDGEDEQQQQSKRRTRQDRTGRGVSSSSTSFGLDGQPISGMAMDMDEAASGVHAEDGEAEAFVGRHSAPEAHVKIALSLYKVQQSIYLLDFQRVEGDSFGFMKLCAFIITELKNLSAASRAQQQQQQQQSQQVQLPR
jgi:hypothetical protein